MWCRSVLALTLAACPVSTQPLPKVHPTTESPPRWDDSFGSPGLDSSASALAVFDDGTGPKVYVGGGFSVAGTSRTAGLACWTGTGWQSVPVPAEDSTAAKGINDLCVFDDGTGPRLFVAGRYEVGSEILGVMAWDGSSWETFAISGFSPRGPINVARLLSDGSSLYAAGVFRDIDGVVSQNIARYEAGRWHPMGTSSNVETVRALAISDAQGTRRLYVGLAASGGETVRWWSGSGWVAVPGVTESISTLANHSGPNGSTLVVSAGGELLSLREGFKPFAPGSPAGVGEVLSRQENGVQVLYAAGSFSTAGEETVNNIVRWNGASWEALGAPNAGVEGQYVSDLVFADLGAGEQLFVTGNFGHAGSVVAKYVAAWNGASWNALGSGEPVFHHPRTVDSFDSTVFDDGHGSKVYIAGRFVAGTEEVVSLARWEDNHWAAVPGSPFSDSDELKALHVWDDGTGPALYVGGTFSVLGSRNIVRWDGEVWSGLGSGVRGLFSLILDMEDFDGGSGSELWVGGGFTLAGETPVQNLARWNGSSWLKGGDSNNSVYALEAWDDGASRKLFVAGSMTELSGVPVSGIASWDGSTWSGVGGGVVGLPRGLHAVDLPAIGGRQLLVYGSLTKAGTVALSSGLARWTGQSWGANLGLVSNGTVGVASWNDGTGSKLYQLLNSAASPLHVLTASGWEALKLSTTGWPPEGLRAYDSGPLGPSLWVAAKSTLRHGPTNSFGMARLYRPASHRVTFRSVGGSSGGRDDLFGSYDAESDEVAFRVMAPGSSHLGVLFLGTALGPSSSLPLSVTEILSIHPFESGPAAEREVQLQLPATIGAGSIYAQAVTLAASSGRRPTPTFTQVLQIDIGKFEINE